MLKNALPFLIFFIAISMMSLGSCSNPLPWPESPLHELSQAPPGPGYPATREEAIATIAGRYAHYDVVAYEDLSTNTPMRTFIVSYGYSSFEERDGRLFQTDEFLFASYHLNQKSVHTSFDPSAVKAIKARVQEVELTLEDGLWRLYRPESPVLLGIAGDPEQPLSTDPDDPAIIDADGDGKPGVTVDINIGGIIRGEIYITRREIYRNHLTLQGDGRITGWVEDLSEQFVIDANMKILRQPSNNVQVADPGLNPIILVPVNDGMSGLEALMDRRDELFPPEPDFY
jgi:hypothetical protein